MAFRHILWLDLETRSRVDLKKHGAYRYVDCPDHRILVAGWALDDGPGEWALVNGALPLKLRNILADKHVQVRAHNAAFDRLQLGKDAPPIERWYCTAAQARAMALPGKLEHLGRALKLPIGKDPRGAALMRRLSIPDKQGNFGNDPTDMRNFGIYCGRDVTVMREASKMMPELRDDDLRAYWAGEHINDRGLPIDTELCTLATQYAKAEEKDAAVRIFELTAGELNKPRGEKLTKWVYHRLDPALRKHMDIIRTRKVGRRKKGAGEGGEGDRPGLRNPKVQGPDTFTEPGISLSVDIRATLLRLAEDNPNAFDPDVVEVIEATDAASISSVAKFKKMLDRVSADGRLRGAFIFNGAYQTNRFSSTGAQVHNYPRLVAADPEAVLQLMRQGKPLPNVMRTLKGMLRPAIAPKNGKHIVRCDWNAIEARALPWLVGTPEATRYMQAFLDPSRDIYIEQAIAAGLGNNRQAGKVVVLSLGYGGSVNALSKMAKNYELRIDGGDGVVRRWRAANPWVSDKRTGWWEQLKRCAMRAMHKPGQSFVAGRVVLRAQAHGTQMSLTMTLPSGRTIWYPYAKVVDGLYEPEVAYLKASWSPSKDADWPTGRLWHGITAENADQAICADLLREALVRAEEAGLEPVGHVHDEIITEAAPSRAKAKGRALQRCMLVTPEWAKGLPLKAEVDTSPRFRK